MVAFDHLTIYFMRSREMSQQLRRPSLSCFGAPFSNLLKSLSWLSAQQDKAGCRDGVARRSFRKNRLMAALRRQAVNAPKTNFDPQRPDANLAFPVNGPFEAVIGQRQVPNVPQSSSNLVSRPGSSAIAMSLMPRQEPADQTPSSLASSRFSRKDCENPCSRSLGASYIIHRFSGATVHRI
jgi:hypothetical protein